MTLFLCDFYSADTSVATIRANGYQGCSCYLSHQPGKNSTWDEIQAFRADGLIVAFNFEDGGAQALNGYDQGVQDGEFATAEAAALGYPAGCVIFFSVDFDMTDQAAAVCAYFDGIRTVIGQYKPGVYGGIATLDAVCGGGHADAGWQSMAWSGGALSKYAAMYQDEFGQTFDQDRVEYEVPLWGLDQDGKPSVSGTPGKTSTKPTTPQQFESEEDTMEYLVEATGNAVEAGRRNTDGAVPGGIYIVDTALKCKRVITSPAEVALYQQLIPEYRQFLGAKAIGCDRLAATPTASS
jgi:hypothetical protein